MKFWQLVSIYGDNLSLLRTILDTKEWRSYSRWVEEFDDLVRTQNRQILDHVLPERLSRAAMNACGLRFRVEDGYLYSSPSDGNSSKGLTALDAYTEYGANALEEVLEKGSFRLP